MKKIIQKIIQKYFTKELFTDIEIKTSESDVWNLLISTDEYRVWNPFIVDSNGIPEVGKFLKIKYLLNNKIDLYQVRVLVVDKNKRFDWLGHFGAAGILDGHHIFELEPLKNGNTRLIQKEIFSGVLVPFVWKRFLNVHLKKGFFGLNLALKRKIETTTYCKT